MMQGASIQCATGADDVVERAHGFFQRSVGIEAVGIENVEIIEPGALQALIAGRDEVFAAAPFTIWPLPHQVTGLRGDDEFVAQTLEVILHDLAERRLSRAGWRAVVVGDVEMRDASVKRGVQDRLLGLVRCIVAKVVPQAK
jgi:hypothetical protein